MSQFSDPNTIVTNITVSGAGISQFNGEYLRTSNYINGNPVFQKIGDPAYTLSQPLGNFIWSFRNSTDSVYNATSASTPWDATYKYISDPTAPAPTVSISGSVIGATNPTGTIFNAYGGAPTVPLITPPNTAQPVNTGSLPLVVSTSPNSQTATTNTTPTATTTTNNTGQTPAPVTSISDLLSSASGGISIGGVTLSPVALGAIVLGLFFMLSKKR